MARKSNKTAHVLNLLSGQQDSGGEPEKETQQPQKTEAAKPEPEKEKEEAAPAPAAVKAQTATLEVPSNISIIDNGAKEADPLAEQIHEELLKELEKEEGMTAASSAPAPEPPKAEEEPKAENAASPAEEESKAENTASPVAEEPKAENTASPVAEEPKAENTASPVTEEPGAKEAPAAEVSEAESPAPSQPESKEHEEEVIELSPEPAAEPEPDYVMLNVMQRVVEDKIIYFMKQFEVCTCDRCKADTIALTLSGLPSKYRIVDKHAVDPLVSYYTGRLISQVTVEALKACTQVKDNPRH